VKIQRTSVGLDVHARSVVACGLDGETGELFERRLTPDHGDIVAWLGDLPGPVAATYEAGPTGFVLARSINAAGIRCSVAAPSKLQRPVGDRVKTDVRDARHLARLLHLSEIVEVEIPHSYRLHRENPGPNVIVSFNLRAGKGAGNSAGGWFKHQIGKGGLSFVEKDPEDPSGEAYCYARVGWRARPR